MEAPEMDAAPEPIDEIPPEEITAWSEAGETQAAEIAAEPEDETPVMEIAAEPEKDETPSMEIAAEPEPEAPIAEVRAEPEAEPPVETVATSPFGGLLRLFRRGQRK